MGCGLTCQRGYCDYYGGRPWTDKSERDIATELARESNKRAQIIDSLTVTEIIALLKNKRNELAARITSNQEKTDGDKKELAMIKKLLGE